MDQLPDDVLKGILERLSMTAAMRFMCTCKRYYSFISGSNIVARRQGRSTWDQKILVDANPMQTWDYLSDCTIILEFPDSIIKTDEDDLYSTDDDEDDGRDDGDDQYSSDDDDEDSKDNDDDRDSTDDDDDGDSTDDDDDLDPTDDDEDSTADDDLDSTDEEVFDGTIMGSCHGLVCLCVSGRRTIVLWNPTTGESRKLRCPQCTNGKAVSFGCGYDPVHDDYKVLMFESCRITVLQNKDDGCYVSLYDSLKPTENYYTYSLTRDSLWEKKSGGRCDFFCLHNHFGVYICGRLHWLGLNIDWEDGSMLTAHRIEEYAIRCYDIGKDAFERLPLPSMELIFDSKRDIGTVGGITVIDNCLCMFRHGHMSTTSEAWVMKEYGVASSWTMLYKFDGEWCGYKKCLEDEEWHTHKKWLAGLTWDRKNLILEDSFGLTVLGFSETAPSETPLFQVTKTAKNHGKASKECTSWIYVESPLSPYNINVKF